MNKNTVDARLKRVVNHLHLLGLFIDAVEAQRTELSFAAASVRTVLFNCDAEITCIRDHKAPWLLEDIRP